MVKSITTLFSKINNSYLNWVGSQKYNSIPSVVWTAVWVATFVVFFTFANSQPGANPLQENMFSVIAMVIAIVSAIAAFIVFGVTILLLCEDVRIERNRRSFIAENSH